MTTGGWPRRRFRTQAIVGVGGGVGKGRPPYHFSRLSTLYDALLAGEEDRGVLYNQASGAQIAQFVARDNAVIPLGPWRLGALTPNKWGRVANAITPKDLQLAPDDTLADSGFVRVNSTVDGTGSNPIEYARIAPDTIRLVDDAPGTLTNALVFESDSSEIEFGQHLIVSGSGTAYNSAIQVYADGATGIYCQQANLLLRLPVELSLLAPRPACAIAVRTRYSIEYDAWPNASTAANGAANWCLLGALTRNAAAALRLQYARTCVRNVSAHHVVLGAYAAAWPFDAEGGTSNSLSAYNTSFSLPQNQTLPAEFVLNINTNPDTRPRMLCAFEGFVGGVSNPNSSGGSGTTASQATQGLDKLVGIVVGSSQYIARDPAQGQNYNPRIVVRELDFGLSGF